MANPSFLLIKPLLKAITKKASELVGKKITTTGVKKILSGTLSQTDVINIARSAIDKKMAPSIARSLGMTTKELKELTNNIKMTKSRINAVKGKNFIKNINRFIKTPQKTISDYIKKELNKEIKDIFGENKKEKETNLDKNIVKRNALNMLEGKLKAINPKLKLPKTVLDSIDIIDIEMIFEVMEYLEIDFYYTANNNEQDNAIYLDTENKGYKKGLEEKDFLKMIENMLVFGYHSTEITGIY